ncbi:hypothetical protein KPH14_010933 [Odynerus spinipes]|uniref:Uncharacterized protein n=1 Tax=Odynerus spinipes TaxID=1348599 RepID=A0AAD9RG75_9HYME|nr:hypothetical protein KPH14_010933 [Odynerus spinipes]
MVLGEVEIYGGNQNKADRELNDTTSNDVNEEHGPTTKTSKENSTDIPKDKECPNVKEKAIPEHEVELQQELLSVMGARLEADKKTDSAVHKDVALRWSEIVKKGLPAEEVKTLLQKYPVPENCTGIMIPKLNAEIAAAVQENTIKRDKRIMEKQERVAACLAAVGKAISADTSCGKG